MKSLVVLGLLLCTSTSAFAGEKLQFGYLREVDRSGYQQYWGIEFDGLPLAGNDAATIFCKSLGKVLVDSSGEQTANQRFTPGTGYVSQGQVAAVSFDNDGRPDRVVTNSVLYTVNCK